MVFNIKAYSSRKAGGTPETPTVVRRLQNQRINRILQNSDEKVDCTALLARRFFVWVDAGGSRSGAEWASICAQWAHGHISSGPGTAATRHEPISTTPIPWTVHDERSSPEANPQPLCWRSTSLRLSPLQSVRPPVLTLPRAPRLRYLLISIRMVIPSIELDSRVVAGIVNDVYESSWWDIDTGFCTWDHRQHHLQWPRETIDAGRCLQAAPASAG